MPFNESRVSRQNAFANHPRSEKRGRLAAFDKIRNVVSLTYTQMIAEQLRQLNIHCRHLYFMKTGHELICYFFKSCECSASI